MRIEDNGPGIPSSKINRLFRAFVKNKIEESSYGRGVGLGLAVVRINLHLLEGRIEARNLKGGGMQLVRIFQFEKELQIERHQDFPIQD